MNTTPLAGSSEGADSAPAAESPARVNVPSGLPLLLPNRHRAEHAKWHVLHSRSRQEKALAAAVEGMGIDCYVPLRSETHLHRGRRAVVDVPLLPGYVFLWGDNDQAYAADRTRRVAHIIAVRDQERLEWELTNLHRALTGKAPLEAYPALQEGVRARVRAGPFENLEGVVASRTRPDRLVLQVRMLGTATSLEIGCDLLEVLA